MITKREASIISAYTVNYWNGTAWTSVELIK